MTKLRAVTYARYSSKMQRESSIEDQQRNVHERARREGWSIVADYADRAISGSDSTRPQYLAMQAAARRGEFDVLLIDDLSRLTRDSAEQEKTIRMLEFRGIRLVSTADGYDSTSKARKMLRGFKGLANEQFLEDHAERVYRGQKGQALKGRWNGGRPYGYRLKRQVDESRRDQYGDAARIGTVLQRDPVMAKVVQEIFQRFTDGDSTAMIARALNARGVPSPGSTWRREVRRCAGWMSSAVRVILQNPLYTGQQRWNTSQFVRDPESNKHVRRARPKAEWVVNENPALRIVSDELFQRAQARFHTCADGDVRLKSGGKPKHLLSGLLKCGTCGRSYTMGGAHSYVCGSVRSGACDNHVRVRRDHLENVILGPVRDGLLAPDRVKRMAKEMEAEFARRIRDNATRAEAAPKELQDLDARLARLRSRLIEGDPDLTADELQAGIARAEAKRAELTTTQALPRESARVLSLLPKAAALYRQQIEAGLEGDVEAAYRARAVLRDLLGTITLTPEGEALWASYRLNRAALVKGAWTSGRDERI